MTDSSPDSLPFPDIDAIDSFSDGSYLESEGSEGGSDVSSPGRDYNAYGDDDWDNSPSEPPKVPLHSWRKKYYKIRSHFRDAMKQSNELYCRQYRALALARRLREDNDQLREILLDLTQNDQVPAKEKIDLSDPRLDDPAAFGIDESRIEELLRTDTEPDSAAALSFLDPDRESEFLDSVDVALDPTTEARSGATCDGETLSLRYRMDVRSDKELAAKNPVSVLNWLRRYQPEAFLNDSKASASNGTPGETGPVAGPSTAANGSGEKVAKGSTKGRRSTAATVAASQPSSNGQASQKANGKSVAKSRDDKNDAGGHDDDLDDLDAPPPPPPPAPKQKSTRRKSTKADTTAPTTTTTEKNRSASAVAATTPTPAAAAAAATTVAATDEHVDKPARTVKPRKRKRETDGGDDGTAKTPRVKAVKTGSGTPISVSASSNTRTRESDAGGGGGAGEGSLG